MAYKVDYSPLTREGATKRQTLLSGFSDIKAGFVERGRAAEEEEITRLAQRAMAGDVAAQDELAYTAPEINAKVMAQLGAKSEQQQKGLIYDFSNTLSLHESGNAEAALNYLDQRIATINARGGDSKDTRMVRDIYAQNPDQGAQVLSRSLLRMLDPKEFAKRLMPGTGVDAPKYQKTGAFLVRDKDTGETKVAVGAFNPADGTLRTEDATFENYDILSKLGETAGEGTAREIGEKRGITRAEGEERRSITLIERGTLAAESSAVLRRGLELLEKVETGGIDAVSLAAKKLFGVEGADEGELSRSLGKAILAQLRETFGAQFTEREGSRLERLEASFGKSVANNKRILQQTLKIVERTARRAIKSAERRGDTETANDIQGLLEFTLSTDVPPSAARETPDSGMGNLSDEELLRIVSGGGM